MAAKKPVLLRHRVTKYADVAVVFVHGFGGDAGETWGRFPELLAADKRLSGWDILSLGYTSRLRLDLVGLWSADPPLITLARYFVTALGLEPFDRYKSLALIAHSMGGLVVQRALLNNDGLPERVSHVLLFGTPSRGLVKASLFRRLKRQIRDMGHRSQFIKTLRQQWDACFDRNPPFKLWAVAGDADEFVPPESQFDPFPPKMTAVISGDHLSIVKPTERNHMGVQFALKALTGEAAPAGPWSSARIAVESRKFQKAIKTLWPKRNGLDRAALVQLALALESVGRQQDAIELLEDKTHSSTDAMGVLAGRLKRRWLVQRQKADAERAMQLYKTGLEISEQAGEHEQAFYHGINIAFMLLAYRGRIDAAHNMAKRVLKHCEEANSVWRGKQEDRMWRLATEGEAYLILGRPSQATASYRDAVKMKPTPRQLDSMYQQAVHLVGLVGSKATARRLEAVFRGGET